MRKRKVINSLASFVIGLQKAFSGRVGNLIKGSFMHTRKTIVLQKCERSSCPPMKVVTKIKVTSCSYDINLIGK